MGAARFAGRGTRVTRRATMVRRTVPGDQIPENDLAEQQRPEDEEEPEPDLDTVEADPADVAEQQRRAADDDDDETWPPA